MIVRISCRRYLTCRRAYSTSIHDESFPSITSAKLTTRSLIALHGIDAAHFLQGITTNNITASGVSGFYSAFLTAQGRVLHDVFIYPADHSNVYLSQLPSKLARDDPAYIIEVDSNEQSNLIKHIKKYKLRAKFDIRPLSPDEWTAWSLWSGNDSWSPTLSPGEEHPVSKSAIGCEDMRAPGMGMRRIFPNDANPYHEWPSDSAVDLAAEAYRVRRYIRGVPEGQREILKEAALPAESNIDYMGGIDFRKGCYVGQELTIRTHHTGVVRKRILPVQLYPSDGVVQPEELSYQDSKKKGFRLPPAGANIATVGAEKKGRSAGKWLDGVGDLGLALCRLETMTDTVLTGEKKQWNRDQEFKAQWEGSDNGDGGETKVKAFIPAWHNHRGVLGSKD
ncbi:MAG: hypothetical protein M1812_004091 [Candelaria pacifica]|nr:MAG: hypothetical protein M1812_004091 [Candelaria pacifica]